jgi:hypothetical protein
MLLMYLYGGGISSHPLSIAQYGVLRSKGRTPASGMRSRLRTICAAQFGEDGALPGLKGKGDATTRSGYAKGHELSVPPAKPLLAWLPCIDFLVMASPLR